MKKNALEKQKDRNAFFDLAKALLVATIIGVAPEWIIVLMLAANVRLGTMTSSPFLIPRDKIPSCKAAVPLETANA